MRSKAPQYKPHSYVVFTKTHLPGESLTSGLAESENGRYSIYCLRQNLLSGDVTSGPVAQRMYHSLLIM